MVEAHGSGFVDAVAVRAGTVGYPSREVAVPGAKTCDARAAAAEMRRLALEWVLTSFL